MKFGIKKILNDEKGSSLSFVLIIGMILMLMVASLLAVANSDMTFTQESVESRQGYIDAKSVIEFGKVEINNRMTALNAKDAEIKAATNSVVLDTLQTQRTALLAALTNTFTVYGTVDSVGENLITESLSLDAGSYEGVTKQPLGVCTVVPTVVDASTKKYTFNLKTQNIIRTLDYKVDFDYVATAFNNWTSTTYSPVTKPTDAEISTWGKTGIYIEAIKNWWGGSDNVTSLKVNTTYQQGTTSGLTFSNANLSLNIGKDDAVFEWLSNDVMNLTANNIFLTKPLPTKVNSTTAFGTSTIFNMTAKNIIIPGDLNIGDNVTLNMTCESLWVDGNINLGKNSKLKITGTNGKTMNQMIVGGKIITNRPAAVADLANVNISNLAYFESGGLEIYNNNYLINPVANRDFVLSAKIIVVKGDVLVEGPGWTNTMLRTTSMPIHFTTQYFDCSGKTVIKNFGCPSTAMTFSPDTTKILNVRFAGGYDQRIGHVDIDGATTVVFGKSTYLDADSIDNFSKICWSHLYVEADDVYLEGTTDDSIQMDYSSFIYYKNHNNYINLYNQTKIKYLDKSGVTVLPGKYNGNTNQRWRTADNQTYIFGRLVPEDLTKVGDYPANSSSGTSGTGAEKYY